MQLRQLRGVCAQFGLTRHSDHLVPLAWSKGEIREAFLEEVMSKPNLEG